MQTTLKVGDADVTVDYSLAPQLVVFSHGFGVQRDSRGLFTAVAQSLPRGWGYVMFDYDSHDSTTNQTRIHSWAERLERLKAIIAWARQQPGVDQVHIVAHSLGCLVAAQLAPEGIGKLIMLAPPLVMGSRFEEIYTKREGAKHDGHTWLLPRTDGSTTLIDDEPFAEMVSLDAEGELSKLSMFRPFSLILASNDEISPDSDFTVLLTQPAINGMGVDGANHDFTGASRGEVIQLIDQELTAKP